MVFLQGASRPTGPAGACLGLVDQGKVVLFVSKEITDEIRDVLTRPKTLQKFPLLSVDSVEAFVANLESKAVIAADVPRVIRLERDPRDEPYLNLAIVTRAHYLVSRDKDLLDLMNDTEFREQWPDLTILDPVAFLQIMKSDKAKGEASAIDGDS